MSGQRQKNQPEQGELAFPAESRSDAPKPAAKETETLVAKRKSESLAGTAGGNPEAGWSGSAQVRHSLCAGPVCAAGGVAGSAEALGPDVLRTQPRFSTGAECAASGAGGTAVHCQRVPLGGGSRLGEIFPSSESRPSVSGGRRARGRQANAQVDPSVSGGRSDGGWVGESGG